MSHRRRVIIYTGLSLLGLVAILAVTAITVARTQWFRNYVRDKIIDVTQESTGGRVEIGAFNFDWTRLRATIDNFVLHGSEQPPEAPLFRARRLAVELKILSSLKQKIDLRSLIVDEPHANVIVYPDGRTNVPAPKVKKPSDRSALETIVELAIKHFELNQGSLTFASRQTPLDLRADNLLARLDYNLVSRAYEGNIALNPLLFGYDRNPPLKIHAALPITIEKDKITLKDAKIVTPKSELIVNAALENMKDPRASGQINARIDVPEFARAAGVEVAAQPSTLTAEIALTQDAERITISTARASLGRSQLEASGTLKDPSGQGTVRMNATLDTGELGRLFRSDTPAGRVQIATTAKVSGDFDNLTLAPLKLSAFGGDFAGSASLRQRRYVKVDGGLSGFDTATLSRLLAGKALGYSGVISGPVHVTADLKAPRTTGIEADAKLAIRPGRRGVPVTGRLNVDYSGAADTVSVANSYVALPNSRLDLSGSLGRRLNIKLVSRNLDDFKPLAPQMPVALNGGAVTFEGGVTGSISNPAIAGHLAANRFSVEGRAFDTLAADVSASPKGAALSNGVITRGPMRTDVAAHAGLRNWKPEPNQPLSVTAALRNGDIADLLALAGQSEVKASGAITADAKITGTIGNPQGGVTLAAVNGKLYDQPYDRLQARVDLRDQLVTIPSATLTSGPSRLDLTASFQHPRDSFKTGRIQASVKSNQIQLAQFQQFVKQTPGLAGAANTNLDVAGNLMEVHGESEFLLTSVNGDLSVRGLTAEGQNYGDLSATLRTSGNTVNFRLDSNLAGSTIRASGNTQLIPGYPTNASANIDNLPIERVLALAGQKDIPARGTLSGTASFSGTADNPTGNADLTLTRAVLYDEPVDRLHTRLNITPASIDVPVLEATAGPSQLRMNASYSHPLRDLNNGQLRFQLANSTLQLGQLHNVQKYRPGLAGALRVAADGLATVAKTKDGHQFQLANLNANAATSGLAMNKMDLGAAKLAATTRGDRLEFTLDSDIARSRIQSNGDVRLTSGYPANIQLTFNNVTYSGLRPFLNAASTPPPEFDALAEGRATVTGPLQRWQELRGRVELTRVQANTIAAPGQKVTPIVIRNEGPVVVALDKSVLNVESAHLTGPQTDIRITGAAPLQAKAPMNVSVNASTNLSILQQMSRTIYADGAVMINAAVRGTLTDPLVNGRMELKNASFNVIDMPNGLSNANGTIVFNGNSANIQSLTAESGGGKVNLGGFVGFGGGTLTYNVRANASDVRVRYPEGASINTSANVTLTGTSERSVLGGTVMLQQIGFSPRQDFGSMLSRTSAPVKVPRAPSGPLTGMRLDVRIRTAPSASFQTSLAQHLQADADLHLRGTLANPGMTGRVNISEGELVFFGTKYEVNQGSISFFNPNAVQPVLNIDLQTIAKGVEVVLTVSGPIENMKLTYRSDPPLQFQELVALLASGKTPTSDPTLLANSPAVPPQSFQQMGQSALVSQAIANPVSNRLQRVFGVSRLKIDPSFTSGSELPQARLTLQQQVSSNVTFTYITNLTQANAQIIRVEWAMNDQWSAIATREENGRFGVDFFYKKKFR